MILVAGEVITATLNYLSLYKSDLGHCRAEVITTTFKVISAATKVAYYIRHGHDRPSKSF